MRSILYMLGKEFRQIFRTREMIGIIFGIPIIQLVILGYAITNEVKNVSLLISDQDNSEQSREVVMAFGNTDRFRVLGYTDNMAEIEKAIHQWSAQVAIIIPSGFGKDLARKLKPEIQIVVDGLDGNTAGVAIGYAQGILTHFAQRYFETPQNRILLRSTHLVQSDNRMWYNDNLSSAQYMIPGIVVVLVTVISMMLSAINLVREKEIGTLEQLMVTPLKKYQMLLGKILPFLILTFIEMAVVMFFAQIIFSIRVEGSYLLLAGLAFLYLFTTLGLGIFVSTITGTQQQAMFISWFFMLFGLMMSGFFIPIENMPDILKKITYLNPMRYFMYIIRDVIQKGSAIQYLVKDVLPMTVYGLLIFCFSVIKFSKRVT